MKNVSIRVALRKDKATKDGLCPLYYFIGKVVKGKTIKVPAKISFQKTDWDDKLEKPKNLHLINNQKYFNYLQKVKSDFVSEICNLNTQGINIDEDKIKSFFRRVNGGGSHDCFYTFFEELIEECILAPKDYAKNTIKAYKSTLNVMRLFKGDLAFSEIDLAFVKKFDSFLKNKRGNEIGGVFNRHKHLRKLVRIAIKNGKLSVNPYEDFKIEKVKARIHFLSEEQLTDMENLKLDSIGLLRSRDMFLLSCYTGLRYSDVVALTKDNFKYLKGQKHIVVKMKKTKKIVEVMLIEKANKIIDKYFVDDKNLLIQSNPKVNGNLKLLAEKIEGLDFNLTYHIARHTFATYLVNRGASIFNVSKLLGHSSIKETEVYAKVVSKSLCIAMELFNKKVA